MRWALMMPRSPALQVMNAGEAHSDNQCRDAFGPETVWNKYYQYGMNAVCLQKGLKAI